MGLNKSTIADTIQTTEQKFVPMKEMIIYFLGIFFYTNLTGVAGNYRQTYLVDILQIDSGKVGFLNSFCSIAGYLINFFLIMYIDKAPKPGKSKFKPLILGFAIPFTLFAVLMFYTPEFIKNSGFVLIYLIVVTLFYNGFNTFCGSINNIAIVITPNLKERDNIMSFKSIVSAIANSAPLVVVVVAGLITKNLEYEYLGTSVLCAAFGLVFLIISGKAVHERVEYSSKRVNPVLGYKDVIANKYARRIILSEFLKNFRGISTYMGVFLAASLLGSSDKFILLGLPTGIGTFIGMLIIKALLKKFNYKQLYIASGIYSIIVNTIAFGIGYMYFNNPEATFLEVIFMVCLFLIGFQFGASNLLPTLFQADVLEDIESQTHKRLEASISFVIGIGSTISGAIAQFVAPKILYGEGSLIQYIQPINGVYQEQSVRTKLMMLFFYTIFHGIMMFFAGIPFFGYDLNGEKKESVHRQVMEYRATVAASKEIKSDDEIDETENESDNEN